MHIMCLIIFEEKVEIQEPEPGLGSFAEILGHFRITGKNVIIRLNAKTSHLEMNQKISVIAFHQKVILKVANIFQWHDIYPGNDRAKSISNKSTMRQMVIF